MKRRFATFSKAISRNSPDYGEPTLRDRSQDCFRADEQLVVFEFGWERMSGTKQGYPDKYQTRFTKQKWP